MEQAASGSCGLIKIARMSSAELLVAQQTTLVYFSEDSSE
jgi:hypothetical protein